MKNRKMNMLFIVFSRNWKSGFIGGFLDEVGIVL